MNLSRQLADFEPFLIARLAPIQPLLVHEATPSDDVVRAVRVGFRRSFRLAPVGDAAAAASRHCRQLDDGFGYGDKKEPFLPGAVGDALQQVHLCPCERFACLHLADGLLDGVGPVDFKNCISL